ncbi:hypothetical protein [Streptomyces sp. NPDC059564]|uniref:hypothetical protein n=1 Tax=Streptomyces sp. NPDC059564 TaxID=3346865 RepID=UPI0036AC2450
MNSDRRVRRLVVGDTVWLWALRHRHPDCRDVLSLHRQGVGGTLRIVFRDGPGRVVGGGFAAHCGWVALVDGGSLNLHEPGAVRRLLDEVASRRQLPVSRTETELDGWPLLEALTEADGNLRA